MISQASIFLREVRRWFSRSEWMIRVLGYSRSEKSVDSPGLVIIQIDGLSRPQLERALAEHRMPFMQKLLDSEHYQLRSLYSGLPSSTPAVQAELFYGVKGAVPTFSFMDKDSAEMQIMYEPDAARTVENSIKTKGTPLLEGGSAYCDIYSGGAAEAHFCAASFGWGGLLRAANPFVLMFFLIVYSTSLIRTVALFLLEIGIAVKDFIIGYISGKDLRKEMKFVAARVVVGILLRELVTIGAKIDIARGLPIIHLNLLGYDEQAHRRGPSSAFAHWSLKGIDKVVRSLWRAGHDAKHRHYDIWIYSDHGQEDVLAYPRLNSREVEGAIAEIFDVHTSRQDTTNPSRGVESRRAAFLGGAKIQRLFPKYDVISPTDKLGAPIVAAMGPVGQIYAGAPLSSSETSQIASALIKHAKIPLVLAKAASGHAQVWMDDQILTLPQDRAAIFGSGHPFLDDVAADLVQLCHHKNAGDFIICGWRHGISPQSFRLENGSHAGFGENETHAFALVPQDTDIRDDAKGYIRPLHLRHAAERRLTNESRLAATHPIRRDAPSKSFRVMTYNVHSCIGMDGKIAPDRIARIIARYQPDVVCLQELDVEKNRTGTIDQAQRISKLLDMEFHFHPTSHLEQERYGDAILTHLPMKLVKADLLPQALRRESHEPRGAIWVELEFKGELIQVINTHLDVRPRLRREQLGVLLSKQWLGHPNCKGTVVFCGDLNTVPTSPMYRQIRQILQDTHALDPEVKPHGTFFTRFPNARIDYIFTNDSQRVSATQVPNTELTRIASDHFPVITDIIINDLS